MKKEEFELNSLSSQMPLTDVHKKCPSIPCSVSWRRFENLVIILITVLNVFFIGILFPMISSSIYKLDKLENVHNLLKQTLGERDTKQNMFEQKIDNITSNQKKHQEKLENFDGMFVLIYFLSKSLLQNRNYFKIKCFIYTSFAEKLQDICDTHNKSYEKVDSLLDFTNMIKTNQEQSRGNIVLASN